MSQCKNIAQETDTVALDDLAFMQDDNSGQDEQPQPPPGQASGNTRNENPTPTSQHSVSLGWNPDPGFSHIDGDVNGIGYNETLVDMVCVTCPGADPLDTWIYDKATTAVDNAVAASILPPTILRHLPKSAELWVRHGIRRAVNEARVLLYRHRELVDGLTLDDLADDLIEHIWNMRYGNQRFRPLFFVAHSVGGLVVKLALLKASKSEKYKPIVYNCHGITFFATPHRGSSYLSRNNLAMDIQRILRLQRPLPTSISNDLRLGSKSLLRLQDEFAHVANDLKVWTFYETIESQLSVSGPHTRGLIVSMKSTLLNVQHESVFALDCEHADCAAFGQWNTRTMDSYLHELATAAQKAADLPSDYIHTPLELNRHIKIEIVGFYDDPDAETESAIRPIISKQYLQEFLDKGAEKCLEYVIQDRLRRQQKVRQQRTAAATSRDNLRVPSRGSFLGRTKRRNKTDLGKVFDDSNSEERIIRPTTSNEINTLADRVQKGPDDSQPQLNRSSSPYSSKEDIKSTDIDLSPSIIVSKTSTTGDSSMPIGALRTGKSDDVIAASEAQEPSASSSFADNTDRLSSAENSVHLEPEPDAIEEASLASLSTVEHRQSTESLTEEWATNPSNPDVMAKRFMWIHTPFTNPLWVENVVGTLANTKSDPGFAKLFDNDNWSSKHVIGWHPQSQASFMKPSCSFIPSTKAFLPHTSPDGPRYHGPQDTASSTYLYLYLPFLHYDRYLSVLRRRDFIKRRMQHGRARPVPPQVAELESNELRMIWEYIGSDPPLNYRRTLDQFAHPSLQDTWARDDHQMLYKLTRDGLSIVNSSKRNHRRRHFTHTVPIDETTDTDDDEEGSVRDGNLLMVDQLWLWAIDINTLSTFFAGRESPLGEGPLYKLADLRNSIYNELSGDFVRPCENALDLAGLVALHAITVLLDRASHPELEIFRIFETAISILTERVNLSFRRFRMQVYDNFQSSLSDSDGQRESIRKRHKRALKEAERENLENTEALMELRDLEDELKSLEKLFDTQDAVIKDMKAIFEREGLRESTVNGRIYLEEALKKLSGYKSRTADMLKRANETKNDYEKLLSQVDEIRWFRMQTELAASQNLSVMIFTAFTVIFLPLSFFTSLFGMNTVEWDQKLPSIGFIGAVSLPISMSLIAATLLAAISTRVQAFLRGLLKSAKKTFDLLVHGMINLVPREKMGRRRANKLKKDEERMQRLKQKDGKYGFWGKMRSDTGNIYQIPEANRWRKKL